MKVTVLPTRCDGVAYERGELKRAPCTKGDLQIVDTRENNLNRIVKVAKLTTPYSIKQLLEVHIVWMNDNKMCLSGFERVVKDGRIIDYAQSWVCLIDQEQGKDNENILPQRENWRH